MNLKGILAGALILLASYSAYPRIFAIVSSGGTATSDNSAYHTEYWIDLFSAYETLIAHGLTHDQITVVYGNGTDFISSTDRFRNKWTNEIAQITDMSCTSNNLRAAFVNFRGVMTNNDTLLFWWAIGHGKAGPRGSERMDLYEFQIPGNTWIQDDQLAAWADTIQNYRLRIFIWGTCTSGGIRDDLANNRTVVLTACEFNQYHHSTVFPAPLNAQPTAEFPYWVRNFIDGHNIIGTATDADRISGIFNNNRIDLTELRDSIEAHYVASSGNHPQIGDAGSQATNVYPINVDWKNCIDIKQNTTTNGRFTQSGYVQSRGNSATGTLAGLIFQKSGSSGASFATSGNFIRSALSTQDTTWLNNTANHTGNLVIKSPAGIAVAAIQSTGRARLRAWTAPQHPRMQ